MPGDPHGGYHEGRKVAASHDQLNTVIDVRVVVGLEVVLAPCSQGPGSVHRGH